MKKSPLTILGWTLLLFGIAPSLEGGTIRLINDSSYKLRAVVRANDETFLGEMIIAPQNTDEWTDMFMGIPNTYAEQRSRTPYRVEWYCLDGSSFSYCTVVPTGMYVAATNCDGARQCRGKERPEGQRYIEPSPPMTAPSQPGQGTQYLEPPPQPMPYPSPQDEFQNPTDQLPDQYIEP